MRTRIFLIVLLFVGVAASAQEHYTRQDSLRGTITPERSWWDLTYYHLDIAVNIDEKTLEGSNTIVYKVLEPGQVMQIDLQPPLRIFSAEQNNEPLEIIQEGNAHFIQLKEPQIPGTLSAVKVHYGGRPREAKRPPWDGGITWQTDSNGLSFIASSCQGIGASIWWPNKDHMYDEVDSMLISVNVPANLTNVSNGRLRQTEEHANGTKTYHWFVANPINNYGVNINIGDYVHFSEVFAGEKGDLSVDYYVLRENLDKAKVQFAQVPQMLKAFEYWFGPYPFYEDGYKLVEAPYLGMEHQSSITYGNKFENGYLGTDLSDTGWGLKFDFIIVHESGHEWFANNITYKDIADMWIHEGFTNYSESLYLDYHFGKQAGYDYVKGTRKRIRNDKPIVGDYEVNSEGSGDMYSKGGNLLHTIRQLVDDDEKWRQLLRGLNAEFHHQTVTTAQIEAYMSTQTGLDLSRVFDQYLRDNRIPVFEYRLKGKKVEYRWSNCVTGFDMPVKVKIAGQNHWLKPTTGWQNFSVKSTKGGLTVDPEFYVAQLNISGI